MVDALQNLIFPLKNWSCKYNLHEGNVCHSVHRVLWSNWNMFFKLHCGLKIWHYPNLQTILPMQVMDFPIYPLTMIWPKFTSFIKIHIETWLQCYIELLHLLSVVLIIKHLSTHRLFYFDTIKFLLCKNTPIFYFLIG